jgi:acetyl-CoA carboxylase biotin carboxyl carrier protein
MDLDKIKALIQLLGEHDVSEFQFRDDAMQVKLRIGAPPPVAVPMGMPAMGHPVAQPAPGQASLGAAPDSKPVDDGLVVIESPMVGTFYRASSPGADPYVEVGKHVSRGTTLGIVEAMKLMNEIESEIAGEVVAICAENAQPVQFGQPLFKIRPN